MLSEGLIPIYIFSFLVSFGAVISPGPVSAAIVTEAPRNGWKVGPLVSCGHTSLELGMVILLGFGLGGELASPQVRTVIALVGGLLLLGLGISYLHGALRGGMTLPAAQESSPQRRARALVLLGAGTTLANPFWYTWWVTVAAGYLLQVSGLSVAGLASFYLGHISADFAWNSSLAILVSTGKRWLTDSRYRALIVLTGGFMLYLGIIFISSAFQS